LAAFGRREGLAPDAQGEQETIYASANVSMRSAWLDPRGDRGRLVELLRGTDIFFHNRRPAFLREIDFTPEAAARERPGLIHGLDLAPWSEWRLGWAITTDGLRSQGGQKTNAEAP
jgi:crotonobetainyl-CoA:carnitine CoA-transferase CaiB-like acyl-CoA transferase